MISPGCPTSSRTALFLEAHRDLYKKRSMEPPQMIRSWAVDNKIDAAIDWTKAADVTSRNEGIAHEIGMVARRLAKTAVILYGRLQMRKSGRTDRD
jgi:hypothetical protein